MSSYFPEKKYEWKIIEILDFPFQLPLSGEGFTFYFFVKEPFDQSDCRIRESSRFHKVLKHKVDFLCK